MSDVYRIVVSGRVQGVGFRYHTEKVARRHQVAGWVRNLPSGEVEIMARLPRGINQQFIAAIREGPPQSIVRDLNISPAAGESCPESGFTVRY